MGQFRVVFGLLLLAAVISDPPSALPVEAHRNYSWLADLDWVHSLASSAAACRSLQAFTVACALLFIAGLWTRLAYLGLVMGILVGRLVQLQTRGTHDWDLPLMTLLALMVIPWGDGFSLDARRHRRGDLESAGQLYGLAIWIPGLMLGLAFAAAAYAKLTTAGVAWITSGAVRYHFLEDAANAPVAWGLWVAAHPAAAIVLSLAAILVEVVFVANIFVRSIAWRFGFGLMALGLFAALYVFQGVAWLPWLVLLAAFLPWQLLDRGHVLVSGRNLRAWHVAVLAVLVVQQIAASAAGVEIEPLISNYPMYAGTYESPEAFDRVHHRRLQRLFFESGGRDITDDVHAITNGPELLFNVAADATAGRSLDDSQVTSLAAFRADYRERFDTDVAIVGVVAERTSFDWERGVFKPTERVAIGRVALPAAAGR